jgi:hypothetical protein
MAISPGQSGRKPESGLIDWTPAFAGATAKDIFVLDQ